MPRATLSLMVVLMLAGCETTPRHAASTIPPARLAASADSLTHTTIAATLHEPIVPNHNVIWTASFQLAWDAQRREIGGDIDMVNQPLLADQLNQSPIDARRPLSDRWIADAGPWIRSRIHSLRRRISEQFDDSASMKLLPDENPPMSGAMFMYACMIEQLKFEHPFDDLEPEWFTLNPTDESDYATEPSFRYFGLDWYDPKSDHERALAEQIRILRHIDRTDDPMPEEDRGPSFMVELLTMSQTSRLILACVPPRQSLDATVKYVLQSIEKPNQLSLDEYKQRMQALSKDPKPDFDGDPEAFDRFLREKIYEPTNAVRELMDGESLRVPLIDFDLTQRYAALCGKPIISNHPPINGLPFADARQRVRFRLDRNGADVETEAAGTLFGGPMRHFEFTQPFLILIIDRKTNLPDVAIWVGQHELLVPSTPSPPPERDLFGEPQAAP